MMIFCGLSLLVTLIFMDNVKLENDDQSSNEETKKIHLCKYFHILLFI